MEQYDLFLNSLRSEYTKRVYTIVFQKYIDFVGENDIFCQNNPRLIERKIIDFIVLLRDRGLGQSAISNYVKAIMAFYKINDFVLNTDKISKFIPEYRKVKKDRAYTHQEIHRLLDFADERLSAAIYILASAGIRIGALPLLRLRNLEDNGKITVYENSNEEYITFCTPECSSAIDAYLDMRKRYGENITKDSFLIREQFNIRKSIKTKKSKAVKAETLARKIYDLSTRSGIKDKELPICHGFRKFFTTQLVNARINPEIREMLLGHKIGLTGVYYKPTEEDMLSEYMKAVNNLTINEENRLRIEVETLTIEKSKADLALMQIEEMRKRIGLD